MAQGTVRPSIHIYPLSRLVHAPAAKWEKLIKMIEEGKEKAFAYYLPMREAVTLFCARNGKDGTQISADMISRARQMGGKRGETIAQDNDRALRTFIEVFYPQISKFQRSLLHETQPGVELEGVVLLGAPHMEVKDQQGRTRFVFLHGANWPDRELKVYLQLLAFIIDKKYSATADQLWCLDLRTGKTLKFKGQVRLQSQCAEAAKHYARFAKAVASE